MNEMIVVTSKIHMRAKTPKPKQSETAEQSQKAEGSSQDFRTGRRATWPGPAVSGAGIPQAKVEARHSSHASYGNQRPENIKLLGRNKGILSSYWSRLSFSKYSTQKYEK